MNLLRTIGKVGTAVGIQFDMQKTQIDAEGWAAEMKIKKPSLCKTNLSDFLL